MFDLHKFVLDGLMDAIGKWPDYKVVFNALGWQEKGVLDDTDMASIQAALDAKNAPAEDIPTEEVPTV